MLQSRYLNVYQWFLLCDRHIVMYVCLKNVARKIVKIIQFSMYYFFRALLALLKRTCKLTVNQLILTIVLFFILFFVLTRERDTLCSVHIHGDGNPVILWWKSGFPATETARYCSNNVKCHIYSNENNTEINNVDAFLFYASNINFEDLPLPRRPDSVVWGLYHEESPRNVEELMHDEVLRLFNFSATFSRYSNVPFPLQYLTSKEDITTKKYFVSTEQKNAHLKDISPVMYLQTDCETSTERDAYVKELMKHINIDSYGKCLHNRDLPTKFTEDYLNNMNEETFLNFIARYKFVVAIENGVCHDYITEKFWRPIKVGTVPIYFGSPTVEDWFPNEKSAILLKDFPSPKQMADHLKKLLNNDSMYEEYMEHKTKEIITNRRLLEELMDREYQLDTIEVVQNFECFICEELHRFKKGVSAGGNIVNQSHYKCPKPISALTLDVNPSNSWVHSWEFAKVKAKNIYKRVINT